MADQPQPIDAEQERAIALLRSVDVAAPDPLRARIEGMIDEAGRERSPAGRRRVAGAPRFGVIGAPRRNLLFLPAATAVAIVIVALVIVLGSGSAAPTVHQTAKLALASATAPAPARNAAHPELLEIAVGGIAFPSYASSASWRASGSRTDSVHGRKIVTVFYRSSDGTRIGYSIVSGPALRSPGGTSWVHDGVRYTFNSVRSSRFVTWNRAGHTCVIAGAGVSDTVLGKIASAAQGTAA